MIGRKMSREPCPTLPGAFPNVKGGAFPYLGLTLGHLTRGFETVEAKTQKAWTTLQVSP